MIHLNFIICFYVDGLCFSICKEFLKIEYSLFIEVNTGLGFVCSFSDIVVSFWEKEWTKHTAVRGQASLNITDECTVLVNWEGTEGTANWFFFAAVLQTQQNNSEAEHRKALLWEESNILGHSKKLCRKSGSDLQNHDLGKALFEDLWKDSWLILVLKKI